MYKLSANIIVYPQQWRWASLVSLYYRLDDLGSESQQGHKIFLISKTSQMVLQPTQPPIHGYHGSSSGVKQPGHAVDHSPPSSTEVKNKWSYTSTPPIYPHCVDRGNFTFFLPFIHSHIQTQNL